ncbi:Cu+-exporting ATPase [Chitinophaga costaii]|uniref:Cu+-exporting ATPase n=1 Tax=Chitinophaga costaii TaxID=1335309 RepID=A0A1C4F335_9BACT|nr:cation-translocating P-type ATPase [Chitinophaga costaii]PUZ22101.1 cadmium-translocating P-type ATPase [Chitinophaga costaii]SCC50378.1 Cu+-exporting ATPase [Chitinophaga costaii]
METIHCKVIGMHCTNCALSVSKYLENKGMADVNVSFATDEVSFQPPTGADVGEVLKGIHGLGYTVQMPDEEARAIPFWQTLSFKAIFCAIFTLPLLLHMWLPWPALQQPLVQLALSTPVYVMGLWYFGRSGVRSLRNGVANMDVLVALGATAAYGYSLYGTIFQLGHDYLFYETAASIILLVFVGNLLEERTVKQTTTAITSLVQLQKTSARLLTTGEDGREEIQEVDNQVLINTGDKVPMDGTIYWGQATINEAMINGESEPVQRKEKDKVIGGTILESGTVKVFITATGKNTVLSYIIELVRQAQHNKPPMQKLADRISAIFVPLVLGIALFTFLAWLFIGHTPLQTAMMRAIAVLVIACPCAMGLATPAAVMVGLGRAARHGILIKGAHTLEAFKDIRQVVFDKTGTLTTGKLQIGEYYFEDMDDHTFRATVYSLEKFSSHPIARSVVNAWKGAGDVGLLQVREVKGLGMRAKDKAGNVWQLGAYALANLVTNDDTHSIYLLKNGQLAGWVNLADELRPNAAQVVKTLQDKGIRTILLSGDTAYKCNAIAQQLGITEVYAAQMPAQKLQRMDEILQRGPTAMIGDGINDAPALAKATIGISLSDATQVAMQSANVVLLKNDLAGLPLALGLGKHTYLTIKQNLFWAFAYNVIAIPIAALGFLNPILAAGVMAISDVVLAINSIRLRYKNIG